MAAWKGNDNDNERSCTLISNYLLNIHKSENITFKEIINIHVFTT